MRFQFGKTLALEIKGKDSPQDRAKRHALDQWLQAVNAHGGFETGALDFVVGNMAGMQDVVAKHASGARVDDAWTAENLVPGKA